MSARTGQDVAHRLGPVACGGVMAAGAYLVAAHDPSKPGSRFPGCAFHQLTGLWCPGCGLTRATHHLLHGDIVAMLGSNVFTPFVVAAVALAWWVWTARSFGRPVRNPVHRLPRWFGPVSFVLVIGYGVVRNLPFAPFRALAP